MHWLASWHDKIVTSFSNLIMEFHEISTHLKLPLKRQVVGEMDFNLGEGKLGTAYQLLQKGAISKIF